MGPGVDRQKVIDALCEHFADDRLSVEDFEARVDRVNRAETREELRQVIQDLPGADQVVPPPDLQGVTVPERRRPPPMPRSLEAEGPVTVSPDVVQDRQWIVAFWSGPERKGPWTPARRTHVTAFQGGVVLDFRQARMAPGVTEINVYAMMGGVEIIVPPGLQVESNGIPIMAGWECSEEVSPLYDPAKPILRISGLAIWAGVEITVRHQGESERDAKRRRKLARREARRVGPGSRS